MSPHESIASLLDDLRRRLRFDPLMARRVLPEVTDHLDDGVAGEMRAGASRAAAEARVVERFGSAGDFVARLGDHATLRAVVLLAAAGSIAIGVLIALIAMFVLEHDEDAGDLPILAVMSGGYLFYGGLTWLHLSGGAARLLRPLLVFGSAVAVLGGIAVAVHSLYLALVTGDWEAYATLFGVVLSGHGLILLAYVWYVRTLTTSQGTLRTPSDGRA